MRPLKLRVVAFKVKGIVCVKIFVILPPEIITSAINLSTSASKIVITTSIITASVITIRPYFPTFTNQLYPAISSIILKTHISSPPYYF